MTPREILTAVVLLCTVISVHSQVRDCSRNPPLLPTTAIDTSATLTQLQNKLPQYNAMNAYIVTQKDAHQSEYTAPVDMRLQYVSGFDGYNGIGIVTKTEAVLWTTEDYKERAEEFVDCNWKIMTPDMSDYIEPEDWLVQQFDFGRVGVDPRFISYAEFEKFSNALTANNLVLDDIENLVDEIWQTDRPQRTNGEIRKVPDEFTGRDWEEKVREVRTLMEDNDVYVTVLSDLTDIAWLFNLRGDDTPYNPVFFSYAIITRDTVSLYIDSNRIDSLSNDLPKCNPGGSTSSCVKMVSYDGFTSEFAQLVVAGYGLIWFEDISSYSVFDTVSRNSGDYITKMSPVKMLRVIKNNKEQNTIRSVLLQDSLAGCAFLKWLEDTVENANQTTLTESSAIEKLIELRSKYGTYIGESLPSITAFGKNAGTIDHNNGATDMSRTIHLGTPTEEESEAYTAVLLGLIELATAVFPDNIYGEDLDILARSQIRKAGSDYPQPIGHGFGTFIVHEGPTKIALISDKVTEGNLHIQRGMYFSNEPAYYKEGKFGVRLEVIMKVVESTIQNSPRGKKYLTFEVESFIPFEPKLIIVNRLNSKQIEWFNNYNQRVMATVGVEFSRLGDTDLHDWLKEKTKAISIETVCAEVVKSIETTSAVSKLMSNVMFLAFTVILSVLYHIQVL
ncbi:xaa-Pro aminopeptidase 1-like isoform X2 [Glandiceps talaboti]